MTKLTQLEKLRATPMIQGDEIRFEGTDEVFTIKAMDQRYLICVRPYTIEESIKEKDEWINNLFNLVDGLTEEEAEYMEEQYISENGTCPETVDQDTFCYTLVDMKESTRGADNFYCKFDYNNDEACQEALRELNNGEMQLSRRNKVDLKIKDKK